MRTLSGREQIQFDSLDGHTKWHVQRLVEHVPGLSISSGRRSPDHNRRVGGSPTSKHLQGKACDLYGPELDMMHGRRTAQHEGASRAIIHDSGSGRHLHVEWA